MVTGSGHRGDGAAELVNVNYAPQSVVAGAGEPRRTGRRCCSHAGAGLAGTPAAENPAMRRLNKALYFTFAIAPVEGRFAIL